MVFDGKIIANICIMSAAVLSTLHTLMHLIFVKVLGDRCYYRTHFTGQVSEAWRPEVIQLRSTWLILGRAKM